MEYHWGPTVKGHTTLYSDDAVGGSTEVAVFTDGDEWIARPPEAANWHYVCDDGKSLAKTNQVTVTCGHTFTLDNESRSDWVILDAAGEYLGQFTGVNRGARQSRVTFDDSAFATGAVTPSEAAYVAWVARKLLTSSLGHNTAIVTVALLTVTIIGLFIASFFY
ncbi:MAG: hypothetical protein SPI77_09460 [Corynebacterium sp.]|nr:hypothetical protein [Corynebacterium sp.]